MGLLSWPARQVGQELMDGCEPAEARRTLRDLVRINRYFGGHRAIRQVMKRAGCKNEAFSLLDVGAASGDSSGAIRELFPKARVVSLDRSAVNLAGAAAPKLVADAFALPFAAKSFDYVFCSLFLHHFADDEVVDLLREFGRVAKRAVLILDLERHFAPYWFLHLSRPLLGWHWMTVHDGRLSVRASFTAKELKRLVSTAGLDSSGVRTHRPAFRLSVIGRVRGGGFLAPAPMLRCSAQLLTNDPA